jgi:hypothetical protein
LIDQAHFACANLVVDPQIPSLNGPHLLPISSRRTEAIGKSPVTLYARAFHGRYCHMSPLRSAGEKKSDITPCAMSTHRNFEKK